MICFRREGSPFLPLHSHHVKSALQGPKDQAVPAISLTLLGLSRGKETVRIVPQHLRPGTHFDFKLVPLPSKCAEPESRLVSDLGTLKLRPLS